MLFEVAIFFVHIYKIRDLVEVLTIYRAAAVFETSYKKQTQGNPSISLGQMSLCSLLLKRYKYCQSGLISLLFAPSMSALKWTNIYAKYWF